MYNHDHQKIQRINELEKSVSERDTLIQTLEEQLSGFTGTVAPQNK